MVTVAAEIERLVLYTDEGAYITVEHINPRILPEKARAAIEAHGGAG